MQENDKALQSFLIESDENLGQLEQDIVALERSPQDSERIASAFRAIHTIKGTCGFFGFTQLETLFSPPSTSPYRRPFVAPQFSSVPCVKLA